MDQITINLNNLNNLNNRSMMNIAIICNDEEIVQYYENQINTSSNSNESGFDLVVTEDVVLTKENPTKFLCKNIQTTKLFVHFPVVCDNEIVYDNDQEEIYYLHFFNLSRFIGRANMKDFPILEANWPFEKKDGV